jgi:outer membrane protein
LKKIILFSACLVLAMPVYTTAAAEAKLGYISASMLLEKSPQAESASAKMEQEFSPRFGKLQAEAKELKQLEEKLAKDGATMTEAERGKLERDVIVRKRDLGREQESVREDVAMRRNEELGKLQQVVREIVGAIGKEEGYDLIFFDGVAYASPKMDLTEKAMQRLREKAKDAPAAAPASSAKPKK